MSTDIKWEEAGPSAGNYSFQVSFLNFYINIKTNETLDKDDFTANELFSTVLWALESQQDLTI